MSSDYADILRTLTDVFGGLSLIVRVVVSIDALQGFHAHGEKTRCLPHIGRSPASSPRPEKRKSPGARFGNLSTCCHNQRLRTPHNPRMQSHRPTNGRSSPSMNTEFGLFYGDYRPKPYYLLGLYARVMIEPSRNTHLSRDPSVVI
jgi:hypothetical protein